MQSARRSVADEDKKISAQELEKLILKKYKIYWEEEISERTINDVNEETLKVFIERANTAKRINFKFTNVKSVLNKLGLLKGKEHESKETRKSNMLTRESPEYSNNASPHVW